MLVTAQNETKGRELKPGNGRGTNILSGYSLQAGERKWGFNGVAFSLECLSNKDNLMCINVLLPPGLPFPFATSALFLSLLS